MLLTEIWLFWNWMANIPTMCITTTTLTETTYCYQLLSTGHSVVALAVKNPCANAGDVRDLGSISGLGRSPGGRHGNPLQYSCLENPMDRGTWQAAVHGVTKSWTQLKQLSVQAHVRTQYTLHIYYFHKNLKNYVLLFFPFIKESIEIQVY